MLKRVRMWLGDRLRLGFPMVDPFMMVGPDPAQCAVSAKMEDKSVSSGLPILNGDHAEFEAEWAGRDPRDRPDWPYPSFDAHDWAEAFCKTFTVQRRDGGTDDGDDMGLMIGWFANALMRGLDEPRMCGSGEAKDTLLTQTVLASAPPALTPEVGRPAYLDAEESRDLAASERISVAQAIYADWMEDHDPTAPDHEVYLFDAMKAAIMAADLYRSPSPPPAEDLAGQGKTQTADHIAALAVSSEDDGRELTLVEVLEAGFKRFGYDLPREAAREACETIAAGPLPLLAPISLGGQS